MFVDMKKFICNSVELVDAEVVIFVFTVVQITKISNSCFGHPPDTNHCKKKNYKTTIALLFHDRGTRWG